MHGRPRRAVVGQRKPERRRGVGVYLGVRRQRERRGCARPAQGIGKDQPFLQDNYHKAFKQLVQAEKFDYSGMGWGDDEAEAWASSRGAIASVGPFAEAPHEVVERGLSAAGPRVRL